jgi:streptogramin lyase
MGRMGELGATAAPRRLGRAVSTRKLLVTAAFTVVATLGTVPAGAVVSAPLTPVPTGKISVSDVSLGRHRFPNGITIGADGNVWFAETAKGRIGRMTIGDHQVTEFQVPGPNAAPIFQVALGPDGAVWFTQEFAAKIGRITPNGQITQFDVPFHHGQGPYAALGPGPTDITAGPDGNLWFTEQFAGNIVKMTPQGVFTEYPIPTPLVIPTMITAGPDGNLWFIEARFGAGPDVGNRIGRITPDGVITEFPIPTPDAYAGDITVGPDGNIWFTELRGDKIGRITPEGVITEFSLPPGRGPEGIATGPDGDLWFTERFVNKLGRMTPEGVLLGQIPVPHAGPAFITAGPDNRMYFTENTASKIGVTSKVVE